MSEYNNEQTVSIEVGTKMLARYADFSNTPSHTLAEFVDNAIQSYKNNADKLKILDPNYLLKVTIDIQWTQTENNRDSRASVITITDNAAGLDEVHFRKAFISAETPDNDTGLNEFGMGMKTAAGWLGESWTLRTSALGEEVERSYSFDLKEVLAKELKKLPFHVNPKGVDEHYTIITIFNPTKNVPAFRSLAKIKTELASIYRKLLRENEIELVVCGEKLQFEEYNILCAPPAKDTSAEPVLWKKDIDFTFSKYRVKGFIALLRDINSTQNGFVLLRRGRVVMGAETDMRYFPKELSGSTGTFRHKRLFGELELEGFEVSFNKNDIQDKETLEALLGMLKSEIRKKDFDLIAQADDYRINESRKAVAKIVKTHNTASKKNKEPVVITSKPKNEAIPQTLSITTETSNVRTEAILGHIEDEYSINGKKYKLNVDCVDTGDLFWVDVSKKKDLIITCKINTEHIFFKTFGLPDNRTIAILKTFAVAQFMAREYGEDTSRELFSNFNEYIKITKR